MKHEFQVGVHSIGIVQNLQVKKLMDNSPVSRTPSMLAEVNSL